MSPNVRILVADDDQGIRDLVRARLAAVGYDVHTARNGAEAVNRTFELKPAGLILDINMPEMDGFSVLAALKAAGNAKLPPVLILTARHASEDVRRAVSLGAKDYLSKPFNEAQLLARVARLVRPPLAASRQGFTVDS